MSQAADAIDIPTLLKFIHYPDSDGKPMAENTLQYQYIITIQVGLDSLFAADPNVFVAGDLLWYPVEGRPDISAAPDVLVALGRPKGHRLCYKQWVEDGQAPQVVIEIISPSNTLAEMTKKLQFYDRYGVQEYYEYDPQHGTLKAWLREGEKLQGQPFVGGWQSPRLGVTLRLEPDGKLSVSRPDGRKFLPPVELTTLAEQAHQRAEQERQRAEQEHARAEQEKARAEHETARARLLADKLRELGIDPELLT